MEKTESQKSHDSQMGTVCVDVGLCSIAQACHPVLTRTAQDLHPNSPYKNAGSAHKNRAKKVYNASSAGLK
jgi:hypothetical protein